MGIASTTEWPTVGRSSQAKRDLYAIVSSHLAPPNAQISLQATDSLSAERCLFGAFLPTSASHSGSYP